MDVKSTQTQASDQSAAAVKARKKGAVAANQTPESIQKQQAKAQTHYDVALSPEARKIGADRQKAFDIAKNTPDVREDKVRALKEKIANGTYQVDAGQVADGILREAIREQLASASE